MVELSSGFKSGTVKFVGETEFQPGEWVGVALDRPIGVRRGYYSPLGYFPLWYQTMCSDPPTSNCSSTVSSLVLIT